MTYYGGKELAAAFRTVRNNTIKIAEDIPERQVRLQAGARHRGRSAQTLAHIARRHRRSSRHIHGDKITDMKTVNFPELMKKVRRRGSQAAHQGGDHRVPEGRGRQVRGVPRRRSPESFLAEAGDDAARAPSRRRKSRFEMLLGGEGARDAPPRPADDDAADDRHRAAPDARSCRSGWRDAGAAQASSRNAAAAPRFPAETLRFLRALKRNNRREWFNAHRDDYEAYVRQPMTAIVERLAVDFRAVRAGARRQPEGVDLPHLSRHALLRQQDAVQDAHRGGLSDARAAEARRRRRCTFTSRPTRSGSAAACTRRRRRSCTPSASTSPANSRRSARSSSRPAFKRRRRRARRREAAARAARLSEGSRGRRVS